MSKTEYSLQATHARAATRVTLIGAVLDLVLGVIKIMVGVATNSFALVSDGVHSLSDLVTDAFVLIITRLSRAEPDKEHPYGHRRFETLGTIGLGIFLFAVAGIIGFDSIRRLSQDNMLPVPGWTALLVAIISIASKEWIYRYTKKVADQIDSSLLLANAWHSRTDSLSSIAVFIGILGALAGYPGADVIAAFFVGLMIARIAWNLVISSLKELVDTALPQDKVEAIRDHVISVDGVTSTHELRTRGHGGQSFVDLHVQVSDRISVSEGHHLADTLNHSLKRAFPEITDVVVHIDPEHVSGDADSVLSLPLRPQVEKILVERWQDILDENTLQRLELHYLEKQIEVDAYINYSLINNKLKDKLNNSVKDLRWLKSVNLFGIA